jgi:hypothetical protein
VAKQGKSGEEEDLLQLYLNDIGRHALLTRAEEVRLGETAKAGRQAAAQLAAGNLDPHRRCELEAKVRVGEEASRRRGSRCSTSSRRATSA